LKPPPPGRIVTEEKGTQPTAEGEKEKKIPIQGKGGKKGLGETRGTTPPREIQEEK